MLLQIALDMPFSEKIVRSLEEAGPFIDIAEVGTPCLYGAGMEAVRAVKRRLPDLAVLADMKIADAGEYESSIAFEAGADYVTVLAAAEDKTVEACVKAARKFGGCVAADLIGVREWAQRARQMEQMGVDVVCAHTGYDMQREGETPLQMLTELKGILNYAKVSVAGGINTRNVGPISLLKPDILVVGSGVTSRESIKGGALAIRREIDIWNF